MEEYFDNEYVNIKYIPKSKTVVLTWKEFKIISFEDYKLAFNTARELQAKRKAENFLSDNRKQGIINPTQRQWLQEVSLPESVKLGMKRIAVVSDVNVFKRYYLNNILKATNKFKIPFKIFKNYDKAIAWIDSFY